MGETASGTESPAHGSALPAYFLIGAVSLGTMLLSREGPVQIIVGGAATSACFLHGFLRLNPRLVGLMLIAITLAGLLAFPANLAPAYWMMGSALGGGAAALLTRGQADEDHHFFLPPIATALLTFVLFTLARPGGWIDSLTIIREYIDSYPRALETMAKALFALPENSEMEKSFSASGGWEMLESPQFGTRAVCLLLALWALVMWIFNRFARRRMGWMPGIPGSLLLFHVRPGYSFLLIGALIFEILAVWLERESLHLIAYPLFALCGMAFMIAGVGVVLFIALRRRLASRSIPSLLFSILMLVALALSLYVGPLVGLADVWLDFRRTGLIRSRLS